MFDFPDLVYVQEQSVCTPTDTASLLNENCFPRQQRIMIGSNSSDKPISFRAENA